MGLSGSNVKAYDNKTALLKSVLNTVMDPPGGLKPDLYVMQVDTWLESFFYKKIHETTCKYKNSLKWEKLKLVLMFKMVTNIACMAMTKLCSL